MTPGDVVYYKYDKDHKGIALRIADTLVLVLWIDNPEPEWMPHYSLELSNESRKSSSLYS